MTKNAVKMIVAWSLLNFAASIFSINIISLYFPLWVTVDKLAPDLAYSFVYAGSMFVSAICSPIIGYFSDYLQKRLVMLLVFVVICAVSVFLIGCSNSLVFGLIVFCVANFCYQLIDVLINILLPEVGDTKDIGKFIGYGTGFGYLGIIAGVWFVKPFVGAFGNHAAFIPTALLFALFAFPCFFLIKEKSSSRPRIVSKATISEAMLKPIASFLKIYRFPQFYKFLLVLFIAFNTINTVFVFMSVYLKKGSQFFL